MFKKSNGKRQAGFTLVEIAIVLVIIGLLIGGVLKGQAMIQSAKVKRVAKHADEIRAAVMTFYDKYGQYPGDEVINGIPPNDTQTGDGDGQIEGNGEQYALFEDLMRSGLISGSFNGTSDLPRHPFGDIVYVYWVDPGPGANHFIRFDNLPWDVCLEIDIKYDDGTYNTGSVRANEDYVVASDSIGAFYMPL